MGPRHLLCRQRPTAGLGLRPLPEALGGADRRPVSAWSWLPLHPRLSLPCPPGTLLRTGLLCPPEHTPCATHSAGPAAPPVRQGWPLPQTSRSDSSHSPWTPGLTRDFRAPAQGSPAVGLRVGPRGTVTAAHKDPELPLESGRRPRVTKGHTGTGAPPGAQAVSPLSPANALLTPPRLPVAPLRGLGPLGLRSPSGDREGGCWPSRPGADGEVERPGCLRPQAPPPPPPPRVRSAGDCTSHHCPHRGAGRGRIKLLRLAVPSLPQARIVQAPHHPGLTQGHLEDPRPPGGGPARVAGVDQGQPPSRLPAALAFHQWGKLRPKQAVQGSGERGAPRGRGAQGQLWAGPPPAPTAGSGATPRAPA